MEVKIQRGKLLIWCQRKGLVQKQRGKELVEEEEVESSPLPPPLPIANPLSGLANYDDDEEEEEEEERQMAEQNGSREGVENGNRGQGIEEEEEDQIEQGYGEGRRNHEVERRRDCPYLDIVNRQEGLTRETLAKTSSPSVMTLRIPVMC
uniref:Uncharacterized protein n=1 Tax=Quercus lobata TaxID=97700 RepID=A0A7N2MTU3_QUELO